MDFTNWHPTASLPVRKYWGPLAVWPLFATQQSEISSVLPGPLTYKKSRLSFWLGDFFAGPEALKDVSLDDAENDCSSQNEGVDFMFGHGKNNSHQWGKEHFFKSYDAVLDPPKDEWILFLQIPSWI